MNTWFDFGIKTVQIVIMILILSIFLYRRKIKGIRGYHFLSLALISGIVQGIVETIFFFMDLNGLIDTSVDMIARIEYIPYALVFFFMLLHFEYFVGWKYIPTLFSIGILIAIFTSYIIDYFIGIPAIKFYSSYIPEPMNDKLFMVLFDLYQLYVIILCSIASAIVFIKTKAKKARIQSLVLLVSLCVALVVSIVEFLEHLIIDFDPYGAIGFGLAILIVLIIYALDPNFVYVTPIPVDIFMIVNNEGTTLLCVQNVHEGNRIDNALIGGLLNAFSSFISDIVSVPNDKLRCIEMDNKVIMVKQKDNITGVLIANKNLRIFMNSLTVFVDNFYKDYKVQIDNFTGDTSVFDSAVNLLPKLFPYLDENQLSSL